MKTSRKAVGARAAENSPGFAVCGPMLELLPLPCPDPGQAAAGAVLRPHSHHCAACGVRYRCAGAGDTGFCAPLCAPCYSIELGRQLSAYQTMVAAPERKPRQLVKAPERARGADLRGLAHHCLPRPGRTNSNQKESSADNANQR